MDLDFISNHVKYPNINHFNTFYELFNKNKSQLKITNNITTLNIHDFNIKLNIRNKPNTL